jgi:hypothetical protein
MVRTVLLQKALAGRHPGLRVMTLPAPNLIASPAMKPTADDGDDREARLDAVRPFLDPDFVGVGRVYLSVFSSRLLAEVGWAGARTGGQGV